MIDSNVSWWIAIAVTMLLGLYYSKEGWDGVRKRRITNLFLLRGPGLPKSVRVEGGTAYLIGWFFLIPSLLCIFITLLVAMLRLTGLY